MVKAHYVVITAQVDINFIVKGSWSYSRQRIFIESDDDEQIIKNFRFRLWLVPIVDAVWRSLSGHIIIFCIVFQM